MKHLLCLLVGFVMVAGAGARADDLAPVGFGDPPSVLAKRPVTELHFGHEITDDFRFMEALDAGTLDWMRAEGQYTRAVMDAIRPLAALQRRVSAFTGSFGLTRNYAAYNGRAFFEERKPGSDDFNLMIKDAAGVRTLVDIDKLRAADGGKPYAINWLQVSPNGSKVAVGISSGGSEDAVMTVYDAASGKRIAGPIDRARFGATAWSEDSTKVYFIRLKELAAGEPETAKYTDAKSELWDLKSDPVPVAGRGVSAHAEFTAAEFPATVVTPESPAAVLMAINGVQNERRLWTAPARAAANPAARWKLLANYSDGVTSIDVRGSELFLLSHADAPTFKVLRVNYGSALSSAHVLVPATPGRVIESIHAAADALYVLALEGPYSKLLRVPTGSTKVEEVALPFKGHVDEMFSDPRQPGVALQISSWVNAPTRYAYDSLAAKFTDLSIGVKGSIDPAGFVVYDLEAKAADGVKVPLSLIQPKGVAGADVTMVEAYGSYGISELADFSSRRAAMMQEGISYGICHVRGGGELGEAWRLGGKDANKPNTWRDLIACGEDLIARGITTKDKLFILGGSAGGITMGRAMEERPDLFAGVIDIVPSANPMRAEFSPNGPPNIPEFGTVTTQEGFTNLYAMDSVLHVQAKANYPAIMITTGLNDPRVPPWEPAKLAAELKTAAVLQPVLLRIDEAAGHGIGSTRTQTDLLTADWIAFVLWRAGKPDWVPIKP